MTDSHTHTQKYSEYFSLADKLGHRAKEIKANTASLSTGTLCLLWLLLYMGLKLNVK